MRAKRIKEGARKIERVWEIKIVLVPGGVVYERDREKKERERERLRAKLHVECSAFVSIHQVESPLSKFPALSHNSDREVELYSAWGFLKKDLNFAGLVKILFLSLEPHYLSP